MDASHPCMCVCGCVPYVPCPPLEGAGALRGGPPVVPEADLRGRPAAPDPQDRRRAPPPSKGKTGYSSTMTRERVVVSRNLSNQQHMTGVYKYTYNFGKPQTRRRRRSEGRLDSLKFVFERSSGAFERGGSRRSRVASAASRPRGSGRALRCPSTIPSNHYLRSRNRQNRTEVLSYYSLPKYSRRMPA